MKSLDYAKIDEILNEGENATEDKNLWWLKSAEKKDAAVKKPTWLKRHASQKEKSDSKLEPKASPRFTIEKRPLDSVPDSVSLNIERSASQHASEDVISEKATEKTVGLFTVSLNNVGKIVRG